MPDRPKRNSLIFVASEDSKSTDDTPPGQREVAPVVASDELHGDEKTLLRLPFGSEFTPRTVRRLGEVLEFVHQHSGNAEKLQESLRTRYFSKHSSDNQHTLAYNCALSMRNYGLVGKDGSLTPLGEQLYDLRSQPNQLHSAFAQHILLNLGGLLLLEAIRDETKAGRTPTLETIRPALENRGAMMPRGGKHVSTMRSWLQVAGILDAGWNVDESKVTDVLGVTLQDVDTLAPRWTAENRPLMDSSKPATTAGAVRDWVRVAHRYPARKSVWSLVRQLRGPHCKTCA